MRWQPARSSDARTTAARGARPETDAGRDCRRSRPAPRAGTAGEPFVTELLRRVAGSAAERHGRRRSPADEWLVTNGLGGYAVGHDRRRAHAALSRAAGRGVCPAPLGRMMMFNHLCEQLRSPIGRRSFAGGRGRGPRPRLQTAPISTELRLENGPAGVALRSRGVHAGKARVHAVSSQYGAPDLSPARRSTATIRLRLRPGVALRGRHEAAVRAASPSRYTVRRSPIASRFASHDLPPLRMRFAAAGRFVLDGGRSTTSTTRGTQTAATSRDELWSPGYFRADLAPVRRGTLAASTEPWK